MSEKKKVHFILTTIIGSVIFLIPAVVLAVVIIKAFGFMMIIAESMADLLPVDSIGGMAPANLIALLAVVLVCFLAGLPAQCGSSLLRNTAAG